MKPKTIIASATVASLCTLYLVRLNESVESTVGTPSSIVSAADSPTPTESTALTAALNSSDLDDALKGLKTKKSVVTIDNRQPSQIYGEKGTVLYFPANVFQYKSGKPYSGSVRIELDECYDVSDMLASKLSTTSDGKMLETAGMVKIKAFAGNKELEMRNDSRFNIYFPKNESEKDDFKLFYGEWTNDELINWKLAGNDKPISEEDVSTYDVKEKSIVRNLRYADESEATSSLVELDSESDSWSESSTGTGNSLKEGENCFLQIAESYLRRGTKISEMDYFNWKLANGQTLNQWFVSNYNPDIDMLNDFCEDGLRSQITFHVKEDGSFNDYYISKTSITEYDRSIASFLKTMPALDLKQLMPAFTYDHACILTFSTARGSSPDGFVQQFKAKHKGDPDKPLTDVDASALDFFVFSSSELGWINCDRFVEDEERVDYTVETSSPDCTMSLVFTDINSVLKGVPEGDKVVFYDIPKGRNVKVVGIRSNGSTAEMGVVVSNTSSKSVKLNEFKPVGINALQAEFKATKI
ncbi:MAG: hypothetical protein ACKVOK_03035 [Flavobacteriales bacterium]